MEQQEAWSILQDVYYPGYKIEAKTDHADRLYLQASYMEDDIYTGKPELQMTRRWFISNEMTKSELVQTTFKCIMTSMEHRVREHFKYRDQLVFGPHFNIDELWCLAASGDLDRRDK